MLIMLSLGGPGRPGMGIEGVYPVMVAVFDASGDPGPSHADHDSRGLRSESLRRSSSVVMSGI